MKISIQCCWLDSAASKKRVFRLPGAKELFDFYFERARGHFAKLDFAVVGKKQLLGARDRELLVLCERSKEGARSEESEVLAEWIEQAKLDGVSQLSVVVGPPDGFSQEELNAIKADRYLCFGKATFPHELAAVMTMEQVYRALSILDKHPYHLGH